MERPFKLLTGSIVIIVFSALIVALKLTDCPFKLSLFKEIILGRSTSVNSESSIFLIASSKRIYKLVSAGIFSALFWG